MRVWVGDADGVMRWSREHPRSIAIEGACRGWSRKTQRREGCCLEQTNDVWAGGHMDLRCACVRVPVFSCVRPRSCTSVRACTCASGKKNTYLRWAEDHSTIMDQTDKQEGTGDGTERHGSNDTPRVVHIGVACTGKFLDANRR